MKLKSIVRTILLERFSDIEFNALSNKIFNEIVLKIKQDKYNVIDNNIVEIEYKKIKIYLTSYSESYVTLEDNYIVIGLELLPESILSLLKNSYSDKEYVITMFNSKKSTFVHELNHHIEHIMTNNLASTKNYQNIINSDDGIDNTEWELYMNNDVEYNAHFRGAISDIRNWDRKFNEVYSTFRKSQQWQAYNEYNGIVQDRLDKFEFYNKHYKRKILKRLYTTWLIRSNQ